MHTSAIFKGRALGYSHYPSFEGHVAPLIPPQVHLLHVLVTVLGQPISSSHVLPVASLPLRMFVTAQPGSYLPNT